MLPKSCDCKVYNVGRNIQVLIYKHIEGETYPESASVGCFIAFLEHLKTAHSQGIIHCDLHLGNFVFNIKEPAQSCIIDWDHARNMKEPGVYVSGWRPLPERHPESRAGQEVKIEHDLHSIYKVMTFYSPGSPGSPGDENNQRKWTSLCDQANEKLNKIKLLGSDLQLEQVLVQLKQVIDQIKLLDSDLQLKRDSSKNVNPTTGSPFREKDASARQSSRETNRSQRLHSFIESGKSNSTDARFNKSLIILLLRYRARTSGFNRRCRLIGHMITRFFQTWLRKSTFACNTGVKSNLNLATHFSLQIWYRHCNFIASWHMFCPLIICPPVKPTSRKPASVLHSMV
jgi:serine/threonine protein kinase